MSKSQRLYQKRLKKFWWFRKKMYLCCIENHLKLKDMKTSFFTKAKAQHTANELNRIADEYPQDNYRTIWEIFCHQNEVDYSSEGIEAYVFDNWVKYKKSLVK